MVDFIGSPSLLSTASLSHLGPRALFLLRKFYLNFSLFLEATTPPSTAVAAAIECTQCLPSRRFEPSSAPAISAVKVPNSLLHNLSIRSRFHFTGQGPFHMDRDTMAAVNFALIDEQEARGEDRQERFRSAAFVERTQNRPSSV
jgi:hypothetical protein